MEPKGTYPVINTLASQKQIKCHYEIKEAGKQQFKEYWNKTVNNTSTISDTIMNNKFETFSTYKPKSPSRLNQKLKLVTNNVGLFSRLLIASQTRDGDLDTFSPPSLSENG